MALENVNPIHREFAIDEAAALSDLVDWVTKTKDLINEIQSAASYPGAMRDAINKSGIAINNAEWIGSSAPQGLAYMLQRQYSPIKSLA